MTFDSRLLSGIEVLSAVVEAGSFSAAARRLGLPKTTVSAKVAGLEKRLGVLLLQRTTRQLRMTEAGEKYFHQSAFMFAPFATAVHFAMSSSPYPSSRRRK